MVRGGGVCYIWQPGRRHGTTEVTALREFSDDVSCVHLLYYMYNSSQICQKPTQLRQPLQGKTIRYTDRPSHYKSRQQGHSPREMISLNGIFSWGFWTYTWVFSDLRFCVIFYPHFSILHNGIHEKTRVFWCRGFFWKDYLHIPDNVCKSMEQKTRVFC